MKSTMSMDDFSQNFDHHLIYIFENSWYQYMYSIFLLIKDQNYEHKNGGIYSFINAEHKLYL